MWLSEPFYRLHLDYPPPCNIFKAAQHIIQVLASPSPIQRAQLFSVARPYLVFILLIMFRNCLLYVFACSLPPPLVPPGLQAPEGKGSYPASELLYWTLASG